MARFFESVWQHRLIPLIVWCVVIFAFSQLPGSGLPIEPPLWYILERKGAHVFEYAVLAFLSFRFFAVLYQGERFSRVVILSGFFALAYGVLDELHQSFVFGRGARFTDVAVDTLGIMLGVAIVMVLRQLRR